MLKITNYTKQDLVEIFNTDRLDSIKRSLDRLGYKYTTNGKKGKNLVLSITETPAAFKMFCINELGIPAQSDFELLRNFFYYFFCDDEFRQLPIVEMERQMKEDGKPICRQTISKWINYLEKKDIIGFSSECVYYVSFSVEGEHFIEEIPKEKYLEAWRRYWALKKEGCQWHQCFNAMCSVNGGTVFKKPIVEQNGIYNELIDTLIELLLDSLEE